MNIIRMMKAVKILIAGLMLTALAACDNISNLTSRMLGVDQELLDATIPPEEAEQMSLMLQSVALSLDSIQEQEFLLNQFDDSTPKDVILAQLETYKEMLDRKKVEIDNLTADSISDKGAIADLKRVMEFLSLQLEEKSANIAKFEEAVKKREAKIAELRGAVDVLTVESDNLKAKNDEQEKRLNQVFYIVGTKNELKNLGLLSGNALSKKRANYSNINNSQFHEVDARSFSTLVIDSKSPKLLTEKPASSYTMTKNNDGTTTLKITNSEEFWETSPYLIVMQ
jgi:chromosome segregation ATPase